MSRFSPGLILAFLISASNAEPKSDQVVSQLQKLCGDCHGAKKQKGKFALHDIGAKMAGSDIERWEKILEMLSIGDMPPEDEPQPGVEEKKQIIQWITEELQKVGHGPVKGTELPPKYGNRVDHDALFSGEHKGPAYTTS